MTHYWRLKKPSVSHLDTSGFSSLLLSQIPSLKFSAFSLGLGIYNQYGHHLHIFNQKSTFLPQLGIKWPQGAFFTLNYQINGLLKLQRYPLRKNS